MLTYILSLHLRSAYQLPGSRKRSTLKFSHWNLNGLVAHEFTKLSNINVSDTDITCL